MVTTNLVCIFYRRVFGKGVWLDIVCCSVPTWAGKVNTTNCEPGSSPYLYSNGDHIYIYVYIYIYMYMYIYICICVYIYIYVYIYMYYNISLSLFLPLAHGSTTVDGCEITSWFQVEPDAEVAPKRSRPKLRRSSSTSAKSHGYHGRFMEKSMENDTTRNHLALPKKTLVTCYFSMIYVGLYEWQWHKIWPLTLCFVFDFGAVSLLQLLASNEQQFGSTRFARHSEF